MPAVIDPMKAVTGELPTEPGWAFEIKWDGMRLIAFCDRGLFRCSAFATNSFPVPLSPVIKTISSDGPALSTS